MPETCTHHGTGLGEPKLTKYPPSSTTCYPYTSGFSLPQVGPRPICIRRKELFIVQLRPIRRAHAHTTYRYSTLQQTGRRTTYHLPPRARDPFHLRPYLIQEMSYAADQRIHFQGQVAGSNTGVVARWRGRRCQKTTVATRAGYIEVKTYSTWVRVSSFLKAKTILKVPMF